MERRRVRKKQGNTHISLAAIKQYLLHGTYPSGSTPSDKRSVRKRSEGFKIEDGELYYIVRPKRIEGEPLDPNPGANKANLRKAIISPKNQLSVATVVHVQGGGVHMGTERTLSTLSSKYYWVGMANTVRKVVKSCAVCLANRPAVANLPAAPIQLSNISRSEQTDSLSDAQELMTAKKEILGEAHSSARTEEDPSEVQYIVTAELAEPEEVDSDLDFDPNCAVVDAVFNTKSDFDTAKKFWQKVEFQVLGPFPWKKNRSAYVIAAMDSFSKWPELQVLFRVNEKTVSQFCMKLIARFGAMEQLILLENEISAEKGLDPGGICQNLSIYNVFVSKENINLVDENWNRLATSIQRFSKLYSEAWFDCLEQCLIPLRNSLTRAADFTPSFLLMGREPVFPESVIPRKDSSHSEVALTQEQIEHSIEAAMTYYQDCIIPDIKHVILPAELHDPVYDSASSRSAVRKSGRKVKKYHRLAGFDDNDDGDEDLDIPDDSMFDHGASSVHDANQTPKKRPSSSVIYKKTVPAPAVTKREVTEEEDTLGQDEEAMEKIDLDSYYRIITLYKTKGAYPLNSDTIFKRTVRKVCESFAMQDGQLMYRQKGKLKKVLTTMKERLDLLRNHHIVKGEHMSRNKTLETIESANIFWKGMFLDIQAFIAACPDCRHGEPRKRRRASKRALRWFRGAEDGDEDSDMETHGDLGKVTCDELADYLKKDINPESLSRSELLAFRKRAKNYKLDKGVLYYSPASRQDMKPRKVLRTEKERQEAMKKAHGDQHVARTGILETLKKTCFWQGMTNDVEQFVASCCQPELIMEVTLEDNTGDNKPTSALDAKMKLYQGYFAGKDVCPKQEPLDRLFPAKPGGTPPKKDLVAAAMESARLTEDLPSGDTGNSDTSQEAVQMTLDTGNADMPETVPATSASATDGGSIVSSTEQQLVVTVSQAASSSVQTLQQRDALISMHPKIEVSEAGDKPVNGQKERHEDEDMEEDEEFLDDEDEDWKPPSADVKLKVVTAQGVAAPVPVRKPCIRRRCQVCQEVIRGENNFKEHMYKHTKVKPFTCNQCPKKFTSIKGLKMHARKHTGHRPYLCNICGRGFPRSASLRYHIKTHDKGGGVPVVCDVCNRTFTTENRMQKHKRFKHPAQAPVFMCQQCGKVFTAKRSLKRHEEAHQGIRKYECSYCKRSFFRKEYLNYHLVSHANEDPSLANYRLKSKLRKGANQKKKGFPSTTGLSIVCLDSSGVETSQGQEVYGQLVEVTDAQDWQGERAMVYEIDSTQTAGNVTEEGTTVVVMEEQPNAEGAVEVRHIILPREQLSKQPKQEQQITIHHQPTQQPREISTQSIEVTLPTGTHTFTLPSGSQVHATDTGQETVSYQVECLPGETLTEDDFNAIRMLAQASLSGAHIVQQ